MKQSYQIDTFRAPSIEAKRLSHRAHARLEELVPALVELGLKPNMKVLDIGAGSGVRTLEIAKYLRDGFVLGIDTSTTLLSAANNLLEKSGARNVDFLRCDLHSRKIPKGEFDFAYMRLVLQHLPNPVGALKTIRRALKPSGVLFIEETDRDWMMIYPAPKGWESIYKAVKDVQTKKGGDPRTGRKLGHYLHCAGFEGIGGQLTPVHGTGPVLADWLENYAPTFFNNLSAKQAARGLRILEEVRQANEKSPVFFYQTWFQAHGKNPGRK